MFDSFRRKIEWPPLSVGRSAFLLVATWLAILFIRFVRHSIIVGEDLFDALVSAAVVTLVDFLVEWSRLRRRTKAPKSGAA